MGRSHKLAYVVSHPIQYQAPLLREISSHPRIDLTAFFISDFSLHRHRDPGFGKAVQWDVPLTDGYDHRFVSVSDRRAPGFFKPWSRTLARDICSGGFDAVWVHGYAHNQCLRVIREAHRAGLTVLLRGESHARSHRRSALRRAAKSIALGYLFRLVDGFLAIGTLNQAYYRQFGIAAERIFSMPYAVDNDYFRRRVQEAARRREELRAELSLQPGRVVILFASKLIPRKRAADLLEAHRHLRSRAGSQPPYLLFVGDGPLRPELEHAAAGLGKDSVRFLGFKNQSELPRYYDLCDIFVLPSEYEPWGLVVNEVMNAEKPIVTTDHVGAAADLVADGDSGFVIGPGDVDALTERLDRLVSDSDLRERMGRASSRRIATWDFSADVRGLLQALDHLSGPVKHR